MSATPASASALQTVRVWLRDWFLLEGATRRVQAVPPERQAQVRKYYEAGVRRVWVADDLTDDEGIVPAMVLYRDAAGLLAASVVAAHAPDADPEMALSGSPWSALAALARAGQLPALPPTLDEAGRILAPASALAFDEATPDALRTNHATVKAALRWLRDLIEPRTLAELRRSRVLRLGASALLVVALLVWAATSLFQAENIALHKTVTISQRHPASVAPADNSGLVNGTIEPNYGIHTAAGGAWVMVDLAAVYAVKEVIVHNRADGWFDQGLPFILELSEDGTHFREVERRAETFSSSKPWVFQGGGQPARYVRIRSNAYIALTEVEVHGTKR